jgi:alpha-maltose-1-phosphate synthase
VHVEYLTRELAALDERADTRCACSASAPVRARRPSPNLRVQGVQPPVDLPARDPRHEKLFATLLQNLVMGGLLGDVDVVHCHTWYSHLAGCLVKQLQGVPLVLTTHSLEPHRPWKVEQLGTAYNASSWIERTAYQNADGVVAVSEAMKHDVQALYGVAPIASASSTTAST